MHWVQGFCLLWWWRWWWWWAVIMVKYDSIVLCIVDMCGWWWSVNMDSVWCWTTFSSLPAAVPTTCQWSCWRILSASVGIVRSRISCHFCKYSAASFVFELSFLLAFALLLAAVGDSFSQNLILNLYQLNLFMRCLHHSSFLLDCSGGIVSNTYICNFHPAFV